MYRFAFDLLPQKSKEEIKKEVKRENTSLLMAFLPLIAVVVSLGLILFNNLVINRNISTWENNLENRNSRILGYQNTLITHDEFIQKTELLAEPVELDVSPQLFFDLEEKLFRVLDFEVQITKYARNSDSTFNLTIEYANKTDTGDIIRAFENIENVSEPTVSNYRIDPTNGISNLTINFYLQEVEDEQEN